MIPEDWPIVRDPWSEAEPRPTPWSNVDAADEFERLYLQAGLSIRQVAEVTGFSREWVRRQLLALEVAIRPAHHPHARAELRFTKDGALRYGYEIHLNPGAVASAVGLPRPLGGPAWTMTIFSAPAHRGVLLALGMFAQRALDAGGRPPIAKLETQDGWLITIDECLAACRAWGVARRTLGVEGLHGLYRQVCADGGWVSTQPEVDERVVQFCALVETLQAGHAGHGLIVT